MRRVDNLIVDDGLAVADRGIIEEHVGTPDHRHGDATTMNDPATRWTLAGRPRAVVVRAAGATPAPVPDRRRCPTRGTSSRSCGFDRQTGQWVIIAALRQDRTYKPPPDQCPLCPGPSGLTSEIPAPDYDVAVFENRFPSLSGAGSAPFHLPPVNGDLFLVRTGPRPMRGDLFLQRPHRLVQPARTAARAPRRRRMARTAPPI